MPTPLVSSFHELLLSFAVVFTQPSFENFCTLLAGWVFCFGRRTVTGLLVAAGAVEGKHFSVYHRFFSRAVWSFDALGHVALKLALPFVPTGPPILLAVDDTLGRKSGRHIWGAGMHHDPLRSTPARPAFSFAHSWVTLAIVVKRPWTQDRYFALPFLFRLFRKKRKKRPPGRPKGERKSTGEATAQAYQTRPQLAAEMLEIAAQWLPGRRIRVVGDAEYSGGSVSRQLPDRVALVGRMPMNAALYAQPEPRQPGARGRPRKRGARRPSPKDLATSRRVRWTRTTAHLYGRKVKVQLKSMTALWYHSAGTRLLKIVVVRDPSGRRKDDCFFTTDVSMRPVEILETIARRWPLEVTFRDAKQLLGFEGPQSRTRKAVERTAPLALLLYSLVVLWYAHHGHAFREQGGVKRPWYRKKKTPSFADMLAALRQASWAEANFCDPLPHEGSKKSPQQALSQLQYWLLAIC
jgi:hypothetical protein